MQIVALGAVGAASYRNVQTDHVITSTGSGVSSTNAFGCLIIAIHDPQNANGVVAHVSPGTPEGPVLQMMVNFLVNLGGTAASFDVLLAGGAGREQTHGWQVGFVGDSTNAGLTIGNVHDCRVATGGKTVIGNNSGAWRQIAFSPSNGNIAEIPATQVVTAGGMIGTTEYTINSVTGAVTVVAGHHGGSCCIIV